jgi:hypothetical protein
MRKTASQIAHDVLLKLSQQEYPIELGKHHDVNPLESSVLRGVGTVGGGALGGLFGGAAGSGLGAALRAFPGQEPTSAIGKALTKVVQNPVGRGLSHLLPYAGLAAGLYTGARSGYNAFDVGSELTNEDIQRMLDESARRLS